MRDIINQAREIIPAMASIRRDYMPEAKKQSPLDVASLHAAINGMLADGFNIKMRFSIGKPGDGKLTITSGACVDGQ